MARQGFIKESYLSASILCVALFCSGQTDSAQSPALIPIQFTSDWQSSSQLVSYFKRASVVGSQFLSIEWMRGRAVMNDRRIIPRIDDPMLFNFDKVKYILYVVDGKNKLHLYPADSVLNFELSDSHGSYSFVKIPSISLHFFLIPVIQSSRGYSIYKRLLTRLIPADFSNEGYFTKGKKYDEYSDYFEYYVAFPGNQSFKKFYLKEKSIRHVFKNESGLLASFYSLNDKEINEQNLLGVVQFINDKKYPD